jgi:hypothetical protein
MGRPPPQHPSGPPFARTVLKLSVYRFRRLAQAWAQVCLALRSAYGGFPSGSQTSRLLGGGEFLLRLASAASAASRTSPKASRHTGQRCALQPAETGPDESGFFCALGGQWVFLLLARPPLVITCRTGRRDGLPAARGRRHAAERRAVPSIALPMPSRLPLAAISPSNASLPPQSGPRPRSHLAKASRRCLRTVTNRIRALSKQRPLAFKCIFLCIFTSLALPLVVTTGRHVRHRVLRQSDGLSGRAREDMHFKRIVHMYMPRQKPIQDADLSPCSWVYIEANAFDGRDLQGFFTDGNRIFEEALRAELSVARAFCVIALESDDGHAESLLAIRNAKGLLTRRFDVFPGVSAGISHPLAANQAADAGTAQLPRLIKDATRPLSETGKVEARDMPVAMANRQNGTVFVRVSGSLPELYAHLDTLDSANVLCDRVDRLVLNVTSDVRDIRVPPPYSPSAEKFHAALGIPGLEAFAAELEGRSPCRTRLYVMDEEGSLVVPAPLGERAVFYSVLAGAPTFDERVFAQTDTWMGAVPSDRVALFTNVERVGDELNAAQGRSVVAVQPNKPELEKHLSWMQSWSHLVRVRETWDRYLRDDPTIKWLALVDDDTLVFPSGMREYLTMIDHRAPVWGGSGEQARIDNGDHGEFALWLRNLSVAHGSPYCYMANERVPEHLRGAHNEYAKSAVMNGRKAVKRVSHMCHDTFCRRGCPSVPQGAAIVLSRALVELLRPAVTACEEATSTLCDRCGSQRLYICVNRYVANAKTLMTRGICRAPWKLEHRHNFPSAITYHAFTRHGRLSSMTGSIHGDMAQLWRLGASYEDRGRGLWKGTVPMSEVADLLGCNGEARYNTTTETCQPFDARHDGVGR